MLHDRMVSPVAPHEHAPIPYDVGYVILIVRVDADNADAGMVMLMLVLLPYILLLYAVLAIGSTDGISLLMVLSNWLEYEYRYWLSNIVEAVMLRMGYVLMLFTTLVMVNTMNVLDMGSVMERALASMVHPSHALLDTSMPDGNTSTNVLVLAPSVYNGWYWDMPNM